ncbi:MAG TPA: DUF4252 domain-containing protein [Rhodothermales bacterium]|nr:DUF4252 domain-containing protein [Rhodothermales bacterium]
MRLASLFLALALTGCATLTPEMDATQRAVNRVLPRRAVEHRVAVGVGPLSIGFARMIVRASGDSSARVAARLLRHVRSARVRVYTLEDGARIDAERLTLPRSLAKRGWHPFVRVRDEGTAVWVLAREQRGRITGLLTVALTEDTYVLAQVSGRFDRLIEEALRPENGFMPERAWGAPVVAVRDTVAQ